LRIANFLIFSKLCSFLLLFKICKPRLIAIFGRFKLLLMNFRKIVFALIGLLLTGGVVMTLKNIKTEKKIEKAAVADSLQTVTPEPKMIFGIPADSFIVETNDVKQGQTLSDILYPAGISYLKIDELIKNTSDVFNVRNLRPGRPYHFFFDNDTAKRLRYFVYELNKIDYVCYDFSDSITAERRKRMVRKDTLTKSGIINSSLWVSMRNAGIDPNLALDLADIYAWTIDFYGIQKGDSYKVVYVVNRIDSVYAGIDNIVASRFTHSGKDFYAFRYKQDSVWDYFDEEGGSLRRAFLKAPLRFSRISSRFSNSRLHPVLKIRRPHHGVDYAAPTGTPVHAIGDGKVIKAAWSGGYGRRVVIKHNSTYTTGYAHLSRYGKGIKAGVFVKQGDVIGYVGMSGLATGPHLDFRFYKNGTPVDPLKVKSPPAIPIRKQNIDDYNAVIAKWMEVLK